MAVATRVLGLVRARYVDFGPTLALEKLVECHDLAVSKETRCKWLTEDGLWVPLARRGDRIHQPRHRRSCSGELIQIDGCDHEWFEERAERCTLLVYIDDATSGLTELFVRPGDERQELARSSRLIPATPTTRCRRHES